MTHHTYRCVLCGGEVEEPRLLCKKCCDPKTREEERRVRRLAREQIKREREGNK